MIETLLGAVALARPLLRLSARTLAVVSP